MAGVPKDGVISIHAPTRGATTCIASTDKITVISIHAPTRGATDRRVFRLNLTQISIHAPTRGATERFLSSGRRNEISIHAPTRGATQGQETYFCGFEFQSTLPREERHRGRCGDNQKYIYFNPRSHERSDSNIAQKICLFLYNTDNKYIIR